MRPAHCPGEAFGRNGLKFYAGCSSAGDTRLIRINHGISQPANARYDGNGAISQRTKLGKPARLEPRRHHQRISTGLDQMCKTFIVADPYADLVRMSFRRRPVAILQVQISISQHRDLDGFAEHRTKYVAHVAAMLRLLGERS